MLLYDNLIQVKIFLGSLIIFIVIILKLIKMNYEYELLLNNKIEYSNIKNYFNSILIITETIMKYF